MTVKIDDIPIDLPGETLGEVLVAAKQRLDPSGRLIVEIHFDGQQLIGDAIEQQQHQQIAEHDLALITAETRVLVIELLRQVRGRLDEALQQQEKAADLLQRDEEVDALKHIAEAMSIWQQTEQAVRQCAMLMEIELSELGSEDASFEELCGGLITQLESLRDQLQARDSVAVADTLAYEWPETTQKWKGLVERLLAEVDG